MNSNRIIFLALLFFAYLIATAPKAVAFVVVVIAVVYHIEAEKPEWSYWLAKQVWRLLKWFDDRSLKTKAFDGLPPFAPER